MIKLTRRVLATLVILAAATAGSLSLAGLAAHAAGPVPAHTLAEGGPFCCGQK